MPHTRVTVFATELGWMGLAARGERLTEATFGHRSAAEAVKSMRHLDGDAAEPDRFLRGIARRLESFAQEADDDFRDVPLDLDGMTDFQRAVIRGCRKIPLGRVLTYGELAERAGRPRAARAVGQVMASNRFPIIVPCHRVVGSNGSLGGYSARDGLEMKLHLLALEGAICLEGCECHA